MTDNGNERQRSDIDEIRQLLRQLEEAAAQEGLRSPEPRRRLPGPAGRSTLRPPLELQHAARTLAGADPKTELATLQPVPARSRMLERPVFEPPMIIIEEASPPPQPPSRAPYYMAAGAAAAGLAGAIWYASVADVPHVSGAVRDSQAKVTETFKGVVADVSARVQRFKAGGKGPAEPVGKSGSAAEPAAAAVAAAVLTQTNSDKADAAPGASAAPAGEEVTVAPQEAVARASLAQRGPEPEPELKSAPELKGRPELKAGPALEAGPEPAAAPPAVTAPVVTEAAVEALKGSSGGEPRVAAGRGPDQVAALHPSQTMLEPSPAPVILRQPEAMIEPQSPAEFGNTIDTPPPDFDGAAEPPALQIQLISVPEVTLGKGKPVPLGLDVASGGTGEAFLLVARGLPIGVRLSKGSPIGNDSWFMPAVGLGGVELVAESEITSDFRLQLELVTVDGRIVSLTETQVARAR